MHAWTHTLALAGALLIGSAAMGDDAQPRPASANDSASMTVDPPTPDAEATPPTNRRDLSELARALAEPRNNVADAPQRDASADEPAATPTSILTATDEGNATASATDVASRENESLGAASDRPRQRNDSSGLFSGTGSATLNTLTALGIVIGLILLLRWGWTKFTGHPTIRPSPLIEVLARTPVAPRNHILLVRIGNRVLIVGDSAAGLRTLASVDDPDEIADLLTAVTASQESSVSKGFNQLLGRFNHDYDGDGETPTDLRFDDEGGDGREHLVDRARDSMSGLMSRLRVMAGKGGGS